MSVLIKNIAIVLMLLSISLPAIAEEINHEPRPVTGIYSMEIGSQSTLATYLSPLIYSGKNYGVTGEWSKGMPFNPENAIMSFNAEMVFSETLNPAKTARMIGLIGQFSWGMSWRKRLPSQFQLTLGGDIRVEGGAYYLIRNGNNPVQAIANVSMGLDASLSRPITIGKLPILIRDVVSLPSAGIFFSPDYGETYYEIYLGNRKGLVHGGWWGNNFRIDNTLSLTLDFGRTAAYIGYRFKAYTQWANNLNVKSFSNMIVIGVIPGGIGLKKKSEVKNNYALY